MTFASVPGQSRAIDSLRAALKGGSVHHAYLFAGPEGVGKEQVAIAFAQALNCENTPGEGCGECGSCQRIAHRNHPDITWVMPEDELVARGLAGRSDFNHTPSRDVRVEQIRSLQERLSLRALEARRKVAIFPGAQAMNPQAQNAFLKTLEEPPSETVLLLLASAPDKLLPTIRSRCSKVQFGPLPVEVLAARVMKEKKVDAATAQLVAAMSGGSLTRALELDVKGLARRSEVIERFEELAPNDARGWLKFAEEFGASRDDAEACLQTLEGWFHDLAVLEAGAGTQALLNRDLEPKAQVAAGKVLAVTLHRRQLLVDQTRNAITQRNGGARLQLERMLIEMLA